MEQITIEKVYDELKKIEKNMVTKDDLDSLIRLLNRIQESEEQIKEGKFTKADTNMSDEEIDDILIA